MMRRVAIGTDDATQNAGKAVLHILVVAELENSRSRVSLNHLIDQRNSNRPRRSAGFRPNSVLEHKRRLVDYTIKVARSREEV